MKRSVIFSNFYVLLWALYCTQGVVLPRGSLVVRLILLLFISISFCYFVYTYAKYQIKPYFEALGLLLIMFSIYGLMGIVFDDVSVDYLKYIYLSLLPTYTFFVLFKKRHIDIQWIRNVFFILIGVVLVQYYGYIQLLDTKGIEQGTINVGGYILALFPLLFIWNKKPVFQYVMLALFFFWVLSTYKRGSIVISVVCIVFFLFNTVLKSSKKAKWYIPLLVLAFVIVGVKYSIDFFQNNEYAQLRFQKTLEGDSSGRNKIYAHIWKVFMGSDFIQLLFGHGAWSTVRLLGIEAHNDWLEILLNQGVLGVVLYFFYWVVFYKTYKNDHNKESRPMMGMLLIIYFISTIISMSYSDMSLPANIALGYCLSEGGLYYDDALKKG